MKKKILILSVGLNILFNGLYAQHHDQKDNTDQVNHTYMSFQAPELFQKQLSNVVIQSQTLKDAFIESDFSQVKNRLPAVKDVLVKVNMKLLDGEAHMQWMKQLLQLNASLDRMNGEDNLKDQRVAFSEFNEALYLSIKTFGVNGNVVYYQYCPMANDQKGAFWLSEIEQIRNPYFGSAMLSCGSTKESLR